MGYLGDETPGPATHDEGFALDAGGYAARLLFLELGLERGFIPCRVFLGRFGSSLKLRGLRPP